MKNNTFALLVSTSDPNIYNKRCFSGNHLGNIRTTVVGKR